MVDDKVEEKEAPPEGAKEEEKTEEKKTTTDMIERANATALRLEDANKELKQLLDKQERMRIEDTLGGHSEAGQQGQSEEEKAKESAKNLIKGSGFEDMLDDPNENKKS